MIRLVCLNIERSKHLDLVVPFLKDQDADVVCLQELMEYDIPFLESELRLSHTFAPSVIHQAEGKPGIMGNGIFSRLDLHSNKTMFYRGSPKRVIQRDRTDIHTKNATENRVVLACDFGKDGESFKVATTHFTWTPDGGADEYQREDLKHMMSALEGFGEFILCGDFNAPRGGEIFSAIASKYKDNIPPNYTTSIDKDIHRAGDLQLMVDGLFSTPGYDVSSVELHAGVSDHLAIIATIEQVVP